MLPEDFLTFADPLPESMVLTSDEGIILAANRATENILERSISDLCGKPLAGFVTDPADELAQFLKRCCRTRNLVPGAWQFVGSDGKVIACRVDGAVVRPRSETTDAVLMLRLKSKASTTAQFVVLNQRIDELATELLRRKHAEELLRQQQEQLRVTLQSIGDGVITTNNEGTITNMNAVSEWLTGYSLEEVDGLPLQTVFHTFDEATRERIENPLTSSRHSHPNDCVQNHTILVAKDGTERFIDDTVSPILSADGQVTGFVLIFKDVSDRRSLQRQVSEQLAKASMLASIIESSDDSILRTSLDGIIQTWNPGAERLFGYTAEQAMGQPVFLMIPSDRTDEETHIISRIRNGERVEHYETVRRRCDGRLIDVSLTVSPIRNEAGEIVAVSKIARDITKQKEAKRDLNESEQRYRALVEASATVVWRTTASGELVFSSDAWYEITGQSASETEGWGWLRAIHPQDHARTVDAWTKSLKTRTIHENQFRVRTRDGSYRWFSVRGVPICNDDGTVREWVGANTDIHDRMVAERTLRSSEAFNLAVFESSPDCLKVLDAEGTLIKMSDRGRSIMEIDSFEPYVGKRWSDLWPEIGRAQVDASIQNALRGELTLFEAFCPTTKGMAKWWEVVVAPVINAGGPVERIVAASRDITERKLAEEVLRDSQARLALGLQLAELALAEIDYVNDSVQLSAEAAAFLGLGNQAITISREAIHSVFHPDDQVSVMDKISQALASDGSGGFAVDHRVVWPDGSIRWLRVHKQIFFEGEGIARRPRKGLMALLDVTGEKRAAEAVRTSGEFVRGVLDSLPEHVLVLDEYGKVRMFNEPWRHFAAENGGPLHQLSVGADYLTACEQASASGNLPVEDVLIGLGGVLRGQINEFICEYPCFVQGNERWFLMNARRSAVGPPGVVLSHIDITQRKQAELETKLNEERLRSAAEAAGFGMFHADLVSGTVTYSSELKKIVGRNLDEDKRFRVGEVPDWVHPDDREAFARFHLALLQLPDGESDSIDHRIVRYDGTDRWVRLKAKPLRDGFEFERKVTQVIATVLDITQQRQFEQSLKDALELAESANRAKSAFLANMSHEIRTPMTAILGYTEMVADKVSDGESASLLRIIKRNGEFLLQIINDILDLSKIEAGKFEAAHERFSPVAVIEDVRSIMEVRARESSIDLNIEYRGLIPCEIESDPRCLKQILINLIGNAIKFTNQGSVKVVVRHTDHLLRFDVIDTGIGMSPDQLQRVFQPFSQADPSVARTFGGTGLGLAISSRLARALGGEVTAQSELGKGSAFSVTIATGNLDGVTLMDPNFRETTHTMEGKPNKELQLDCRILIVDDRRDIRYLSKYFLSQAGASTLEAEDGEQAIQRVADSMKQNLKIDLILLDMQMPRLDGYATAIQLRELGYKGPIIALTADAMQGDMTRCIDCGCDDYLSKPIDKQHLLAKVSHFLEKSSSVLS